MNELITKDWRACDKTINSLKAGKWSDEQRKRILMVFIERNYGKEIDNPSAKYSKMVRFETPRDAKPKDTGTEKLLSDKRADLSNKSEQGEQRAKEVKESSERLTQDQAIAFYNERK